MTVYVGTSGWQYDDWKPVLYEGVPKAKWLEHFATKFVTVEVNNTFYRLPKIETFSAWRARTPDGFVFAVKASRFITHDRRLRDVSEPITTLVERASALGPKLGPILYQLPPSMRRDDTLLKEFLDVLPPYPRATMEFRHDSWFDDAVLSALRERNVALCVVDGEKAKSPVVATGDWAYVRLHGPPGYAQYSSEQNRAWAERVARLAGEGADPVFVYFDNDVEGNALRDAVLLRETLASMGVVVAIPETNDGTEPPGALPL